MSEELIIKWIMIAILFLGTIFFAIGICIYLNCKRKERLCTLHVNATVVDLVRNSTTSRGYNSYYCPLFEYYAGGEKLRRMSSYGSTNPSLQVGDTVELHVNPEKTTEFYYGQDKSKTVAVIFLLVGILLMLIGVAIGWFMSAIF